MFDTVLESVMSNGGRFTMAVKIVHETHGHQVRFGDRATAEHYAAEHGGLAEWRVVVVPAAVQSEKSSGSQVSR